MEPRTVRSAVPDQRVARRIPRGGASGLGGSHLGRGRGAPAQGRGGEELRAAATQRTLCCVRPGPETKTLPLPTRVGALSPAFGEAVLVVAGLGFLFRFSPASSGLSRRNPPGRGGEFSQSGRHPSVGSGKDRLWWQALWETEKESDFESGDPAMLLLQVFGLLCRVLPQNPDFFPTAVSLTPCQRKGGGLESA